MAKNGSGWEFFYRVICYNNVSSREQVRFPEKEVLIMFTPRGYFTQDGYIGFLPDGTKLHFPTYDEYIEYVEEAAA